MSCFYPRKPTVVSNRNQFSLKDFHDIGIFLCAQTKEDSTYTCGYCKIHFIAVLFVVFFYNCMIPTFYYHVKQLRKKACEIPESIYSGISEKQDVVPVVIHDLPLPQNDAVISEPIPQSDEIVLRLTIQGVTVEITNQATQSVIQNTLSVLRYLC